MSKYNRFGAVYTDVIGLYPGTVVADYDAGGANGQAKIEAVLDRITMEVAAALTAEVYRQITQVYAEEVVRYAVGGQTSITLGLKPIVAGTLHLWRYPGPGANAGQGWGDDWYLRGPVPGLNEVPTGNYSVNVTTGVVTLSGLSLSAGERVFASYDVDIDAATFSLPSVAYLVILGAASELGAVLFSTGAQEWKLVEDYRERYRGRYVVQEGGAMAKAFAGNWIPDELRRLNYWKEVERSGGGQWGTVRLDRA